MFQEEELKETIRKLENRISRDDVWFLTILLIFIFGIMISSLIIPDYFNEKIDLLKNDLEYEKSGWYEVPRDSIPLSTSAKSIEIANGLISIQYKDSLEFKPLKSHSKEYKSISVSIDKIARQNWLFKKLGDGRVISYPPK